MTHEVDLIPIGNQSGPPKPDWRSEKKAKVQKGFCVLKQEATA